MTQRLRSNLSFSEMCAVKESLGKGNVTFVAEYRGSPIAMWNKATDEIPVEFLETPTAEELEQLLNL